MIGSGESYFATFALYFMVTTAQIGVLAKLPSLLGSLAQLISAWFGRRLGKRKPIIITGALLQGVSLIPLTMLPIKFPEHALSILICFAIIYFSGTNIATPQWGSLMGDLVAARRRGRYFGHRIRLCSITSFTALIMAGTLLDQFDRSNYTLVGYVIIFMIAAIARFISVYHLSQMYDPPGHVAVLESPFQKGLWHRLRGSSFVRFSVFFYRHATFRCNCSPVFCGLYAA